MSPRRDRKSETTTREKWPQKGLSANELSVAGFGRLGGGGCSRAKPVSKRRNREFFENFRSEQAADALMAANQSNFDSNPNQIHKR